MKKYRLWSLSLLFVILFSFSSFSAENDRWIHLPQSVPGFIWSGSTDVEKLRIRGYEEYHLENVVWSSSDSDILEIIDTTDESVTVLAKKVGNARITVDFDFYYMDEVLATPSDASSSNVPGIPTDMVMETEHYTLSIGYVVIGVDGDFEYMERLDGITIHRYTGSSEHVIIPESINGKPVTAIYHYAISNESIKQITVSDTVKQISFYAFYECRNLEIINLPADLEYISEVAIYECPALNMVKNNSSMDIDLAYFSDTLDHGVNTIWYSGKTGGVLLDDVLPAKSTMYRRFSNESVRKGSSSGRGQNIVTEPQSYAAKVNSGEIIPAGSYLTAGAWEQEGQIWKCLDGEGNVIRNSWIIDQGKWYLTDQSGTMITGWQLVNNKWYLFAADGAMLVGWQYVNDLWYFMDQSGALLTNTLTPDGYQVNSDGVWIG